MKEHIADQEFSPEDHCASLFADVVPKMLQTIGNRKTMIIIVSTGTRLTQLDSVPRG
jgi:hypothetical protein